MHTVSTEIHLIEVSEGCLTIGEYQFPDNCVSLSPEETTRLLHILLAAQAVKPGQKIEAPGATNT
jgi:hypothetical protein